MRTNLPNFNGYRWTALDILLAIGVVVFLGSLALRELLTLGFSLTSVAGVVWGFGTLMFFALYPFPLLGGSIEGDKLRNANRPLTHDELRVVLGLRYFTKMSPTSIRLFLVFFFVSGGLTLLGVVTNT